MKSFEKTSNKFIQKKKSLESFKKITPPKLKSNLLHIMKFDTPSKVPIIGRKVFFSLNQLNVNPGVDAFINPILLFLKVFMFFSPMVLYTFMYSVCGKCRLIAYFWSNHTLQVVIHLYSGWVLSPCVYKFVCIKCVNVRTNSKYSQSKKKTNLGIRTKTTPDWIFASFPGCCYIFRCVFIFFSPLSSFV